MVPLQVFKANALSLQQRQWRIINPGALSPWNVMTWGMKQLRGFVVGSDTPETSARLQVQELVLVENLKVWLSRNYADHVLIGFHRRQQIG
jgi:charged multivesicular body protein 7